MSRSVLAIAALYLFVVVLRANGDTGSDVLKAATEAHRNGDVNHAKELLMRALSDTEIFGTGDSRRTAVKLHLAESLLQLGEYARCEQLCLESIEELRKQFGESHLQIAESERILTELYLQLGMSVLADRHCKRGLTICESIHGQWHPDIAAFHANMRHIWNQRSSGNSHAAENTVELLEESFGTSDPRLISPLEAIAGDCYDRWRTAKAARALSIAEANYGKRHPIYGRCLSTYATALRHTKDFEQAERVSKQAIEVLSETFGQNSPQLSAGYRNLASVEQYRGHSDRADALFLDAIRLRFSTLSDPEICHFFQQFLDSEQAGSYDDDLLDTYLTEMHRRGGETIEQFLASKIENLRQKYLQTIKELEGEESDESDELNRRHE